MNLYPEKNSSRRVAVAPTPTERLFQSMPFLAHSQRSPIKDWSPRHSPVPGDTRRMSTAWSPIGTPPSSYNTREEGQKQSQLQAYVAWVNSQLRKRPGGRQVEELRRDMQDGMALVQLIEVVSAEKLLGIHLSPQNITEMRENVDKVLQFMVSHRIKMHQISAKDIVDGNLKSIMRLILALAAHYKPGSVKQSAHQQYRSPTASPNVASMAQGASAALAEIRRDAANVGQKIRRPLNFAGDNSPRYYGSSSEQFSDSDQSSIGRGRPVAVARPRERDVIDGASTNSSPSNSAHHSPQSSISGSMAVPRSKSDFYVHQVNQQLQSAASEADKKNKDNLLQELINEYSDVEKDIMTTRKTLLALQELLLNGMPLNGSEESEELPFEGSTPSEQSTVLRSRLQQTTELCNDLREELSKSKKECMQLQGTKAGLQQRLTEQENSLLQMKAELLRIGFSQQSLEAERNSVKVSVTVNLSSNELQKKLSEKDKMIAEYRRDVLQKDRYIEELRADLQVQMQEKDATTRTLRGQLHDLHDKLRLVGETEASLSAKVVSQDRKMAKLENRILDTEPTGPRPPVTGAQNGSGDEFQIVQESLRAIRGHFHGNDTQRHTIDTLEETISSLLEKLQFNESKLSSTDGASHQLDFERKRLAVGHPVQRPDSGSSGIYRPSTKVLYFTDQSDTPFMKTIHKRLGEITFGDFRKLFDKPGHCRFHFKALDPEFGTVKEEISCDDDIVPGWEGKIVAWIEEEHG